MNYGARYDRFDASFEHQGQISPRVNLVWKINDKTAAHLGYARYFTPPSVQYVSPEPSYYPVNLGVEHVFHTKSDPIKAVKLRFDCLNVADEVYQLRDGSGIGINAAQYGQRRTFLGGLSMLW